MTASLKEAAFMNVLAFKVADILYRNALSDHLTPEDMHWLEKVPAALEAETRGRLQLIESMAWSPPMVARLWRPIAEAPKGEPDADGDIEGPWLLVWLPKVGLPWPARWCKMEWAEEGEWQSYYTEALGSSTNLSEDPTHFMLPPEGPCG